MTFPCDLLYFFMVAEHSTVRDPDGVKHKMMAHRFDVSAFSKTAVETPDKF